MLRIWWPWTFWLFLYSDPFSSELRRSYTHRKKDYDHEQSDQNIPDSHLILLSEIFYIFGRPEFRSDFSSASGVPYHSARTALQNFVYRDCPFRSKRILANAVLLVPADKEELFANLDPLDKSLAWLQVFAAPGAQWKGNFSHVAI